MLRKFRVALRLYWAEYMPSGAVFGLDPFTLLVVGGIVLASAAVSAVFAPKPKRQKPPEATDLESPTAEAGRPIPVVFGTITLTGPNILWYGDKDVRQYEVDA